jgi:multiple sugar transport system permease protein
VFSPVYTITKGGPLDSTDVAVFHIYRESFQEFNFGYASAMAWVLFAVIFIATLAQFWYMRRQREEIQF